MSKIHLTPEFSYMLVIFLLMSFLAVQYLTSSQSVLSPGNYGRYLDTMWANELIENGFLRAAPFPDYPSLFSNANSYHFNLIPSIFIAVINLVTSIPITKIQMLPLYGIVFFFSTLLVGLALYQKNYLSAIFVILLACFFTYPNNQIIREINRIALSYIVFYYFLYIFLNETRLQDIRFRLLEVFFAIFFIFTYSSNAVSVSLLIMLLYSFRAYRNKNIMSFLLSLLYFIVCIYYYLIISDFLVSGILVLKQISFNDPFSFLFTMFSMPGIWPSELVYIPSYTIFDWFFLIYPFIVLSLLLVLTFIYKFKELLSNRYLGPYMEIYLAIGTFILLIILFNSFAKVYSAGFNYISLFSWLSPLLAAHFLSKYLNKDSYFMLRLLSLAIIFGLGIYGIFNYSLLDPREGEIVSEKEVKAGEWLRWDGLIVSSDFHFLSTYVTINTKKAHHYLPKSDDKFFFYYPDKGALKINHINLFVVTNIMKEKYITHFDGTRTTPSPSLTAALSSSLSKVYINGANDIFYIPY